jgi:ADP-ribose pyrophosphatase YjhB (NUDIX family)
MGENSHMSSNKERGKVWLGVSGLVVNKDGKWLVVKKRYGGLDGRWSFPAGFVQEGETIDEAVMREVSEETGIETDVQGLMGFRTGVIKGEISDNMAIFMLTPTSHYQQVIPQLEEIYEASWMTPIELSLDPNTSVMIHELANKKVSVGLQVIEGINPGDIFGYTSYKLYF